MTRSEPRAGSTCARHCQKKLSPVDLPLSCCKDNLPPHIAAYSYSAIVSLPWTTHRTDFGPDRDATHLRLFQSTKATAQVSYQISRRAVMPRRAKVPESTMAWASTNGLRDASRAAFPLMDHAPDVSYLDDLYRAAQPKKPDAAAADAPSSAASKKRKRAGDDSAATPAKRASMSNANGDESSSTYPPPSSAHDNTQTQPSAASGSTPDISTTAAAALTAHLGAASAANAMHDTQLPPMDPGAPHASTLNNNATSPDANADDNADGMTTLLGGDTEYSLHASVLGGAPPPAADGDQQPYLTWKGEMSVERGADGGVIHVPAGMVLGPAGFPIRPPVGSEIWHKFRRDNHKEGTSPPSPLLF